MESTPLFHYFNSSPRQLTGIQFQRETEAQQFSLRFRESLGALMASQGHREHEEKEDAELMQKIGEVERQFLEKLDLKVTLSGGRFPVHTYHGTIEGRSPPGQEALFFGSIVLEELQLYPRTLLAKIGLEMVVLVSDLAFAGQPRKAVPDLGASVMYFDVRVGGYNDRYTRKVIHHEIFHFLDHKYSTEGLYHDSLWESLNPPGFSYGQGGVNSQDVIIVEGHTTHREEQNASRKGEDTSGPSLPGFLNQYCLSGVEEDKAEVFAAMILGFSTLVRDCERDPVLESKVSEMMRFISTVDSSVPDDPGFWTQLEIASKGLRHTASADPGPEDPPPALSASNDFPVEVKEDKAEDTACCPLCPEEVPVGKLRDHIKLCGASDPGLVALMLRMLDQENE